MFQRPIHVQGPRPAQSAPDHPLHSKRAPTPTTTTHWRRARPNDHTCPRYSPTSFSRVGNLPCLLRERSSHRSVTHPNRLQRIRGPSSVVSDSRISKIGIALQTTVITNAMSSLADLRRAILGQGPSCRFYGFHVIMENIHSETAPDRYLHQGSCAARIPFSYKTSLAGSLSALHPVVRDPCLWPVANDACRSFINYTI